MYRWLPLFVAALFLLSPMAWAADASSCFTVDDIFNLNSPFFALIGLALLTLEFFVLSKGLLATLGAIAFLYGTSNLLSTPCTTLQMSLLEVVILNVFVLGTFAIIGYVTITGYRRHENSELDPILGRIGEVVDWTATQKRVSVGGAVWQAKTTDNTILQPGQTVRVVAQDNLTLTVTPITGDTA